MKTTLLLLAGLSLSPGLWAQSTTYLYTGNSLSVSDFTPPCGTGPCANFPAGAHWSGQLTTSSPLPSSAPMNNIFSMVSSFSFTNGLNFFSSADSNLRVNSIFASTDVAGNIALGDLTVFIWQSGSSPHSSGDRLAFMQINLPDLAYNNRACQTVGISYSGVLDSCILQAASDASTSEGAQNTPGTWTKATASSPVQNGASSRKLHGAAGSIDMPLSPGP